MSDGEHDRVRAGGASDAMMMHRIADTAYNAAMQHAGAAPPARASLLAPTVLYESTLDLVDLATCS
jgi:hypothetical protein